MASYVASSPRLASQKNIDSLLEQNQRTLQTSLKMGLGIMDQLAKQEEALVAAEDTVEATGYVLDQSVTYLRGMTWTGMFYNALSMKSTKVPEIKIKNSHMSEKNNPIAKNYALSNSDFPRTLSNTTTQTETSNEDEQIIIMSRYLDEIEKTAIAIGTSLESQNESIDRINFKTDNMVTKTLEASLKASRITSNSASPDFVGRFQFLAGDKFLCVKEDDCLYLTTHVNRSTLFDAYIKEDNLLGLKSTKTLKFLGITLFGAVKVHSEQYGRSEELFVSLSGKATGLFFLSKNWGAGGWLKDVNSDDPDSALNKLTSSIHDKEGMILFTAKPVLIE